MKCQTVSVEEASELLGVGRLSLYSALRDGRVPAIRVGRKPRFRIPLLAIERLLARPEEWEAGRQSGERSRGDD